MWREAVTMLVVPILYSAGISMHTFPCDKVLCQKWTSFVRKHQPNFKPLIHSALYSAHFELTCFTLVTSVVTSALEKGSIPTRDAVVSFSPGPLTSCEKRQVSIEDLVISLCSFQFSLHE